MTLSCNRESERSQKTCHGPVFPKDFRGLKSRDDACYAFEAYRKLILNFFDFISEVAEKRFS